MKRTTSLALVRFIAAALILSAPLAGWALGYSATPCSGAVGQEVEMAVTFSTGGADVCALSADLSFDGSRLAFAGASAGPAGAASGKNLVSQPMGSGGARLALLGMNSTPIRDGIAFSVRFRIQGTTSGNTGVAFRGGAASCAGGDLPPFSTVAMVTIQAGSSDEIPPAEGEPSKSGNSSQTVDTGAAAQSTSSTGSVAQAASESASESAGASLPAENEGAKVDEKGSPDATPKPLSAKAVLTNRKGPSPMNVKFRAQVEGGKKPYAYTWDFGDESEKASKGTLVHAYERPGTYRPTLDVKDADGELFSVDCDEVIVSEPPVPELGQVWQIRTEEGWNLEINGKKLQKGCVAMVAGKEYPTEFANAQRVSVKGIPDSKGADLTVAVANPYGQATKPVPAALKPDSPPKLAKP